jgi:hypothetical protein
MGGVFGVKERRCPPRYPAPLPQQERAVEVGILLPCLQQAFGLEPFEVRQVAQRGEPERLQEFPRGDIRKRRAGLRGADRAVDQPVAFERGDVDFGFNVGLESSPEDFSVSIGTGT